MKTPQEEIDRCNDELAALTELEGRLTAWKPTGEPIGFARDSIVSEIRDRMWRLRKEVEHQRQLGILLAAMGGQPPGG